VLLDALEPGATKLSLEFGGSEEELEGFPGGGDTPGKRIKCQPLEKAERFAGEAIVEADAASCGQGGYGFKGRAECIPRQVGDHAEPSEERGHGCVESRAGQSLGQGSVFKVEGNIGEGGGDGDSGFSEEGAFIFLRGGKVDFEDAEMRMRVAIGVRVKTCAENYVLGDPSGDGEGELIFGKAAARGHVGAEGARHGVLFAIESEGKTAPEERDGERVAKDARLVEELVNGASLGHTKCGTAGAARFHEMECTREEGREQRTENREQRTENREQRTENGEQRTEKLGPAMESFTTVRCATRMLIAMNWVTSWMGWALLSAVFAAATAILAKVGVAHVDSNLATALRTSVVVVFAWGIALVLGKHGEIRSLDGRTLLFLALSGLATGLSWLCYFRALQLGPASRVAPLDKLSVPLVMVFSWLLLGERLNGAAIAGGLLITAGAVVMVLS